MCEPLCHKLAVLVDNSEHRLVDCLLLCVSDTLYCCKGVVHAPESALHCAHVAVGPLNVGPHGLQPHNIQPLPAGLKASAGLQVLGRVGCLAVAWLGLLKQDRYGGLLAGLLL